MSSRGGRLALLCALGVPALAFALAWTAAERAVDWMSRAPPGRFEEPVTVDIPRGTGAGAVARRLAAAGIVPQAEPFRLLLAATGQGARLQAGEYGFERPVSPWEVAEILVAGRVLLHAFTVPEGLDLHETATAIAAGGRFDREQLLAVFRDPALVRDLDPEATDLEGYLFPETYNLPRTATAGDVAEAMTLAFRRTWEELRGAEAASRLGLRLREVAALAALVESETAVPGERALVSSVYHRRLQRGMLLQCDPTVIAALERDGLWPGGEITRSQLRYESPWNTYVSVGLPPGPISSFGRAALAAALEPADTDYLFFVATGDGGHRFARTLSEHEDNVRQWRTYQRDAGLR